MADTPKRIQRKRTRGWRMILNTFREAVAWWRVAGKYPEAK